MKTVGSSVRRSRRDVAPNFFYELAEAAMDRRPVTGWTHNFYRYPARFSPQFAAAAIQYFSRPSDLVLDPYMGGGTAIVEAMAAGRSVIGNDLNALATFITRVKTTVLSRDEIESIRSWGTGKVSEFHYHRPSEDLMPFIDPDKTTNLTMTRARFIKKIVAEALASIGDLPTENSRNFVRCVVLRVGQWALDGRSRQTSLDAFREKLTSTSDEMLRSIRNFGFHLESSGGRTTILNLDACELDQASVFQQTGKKVSLVVTSPPYPGVHVLYHRWQVDGRRESPAPYWISGCNDGRGATFYNFGDRRDAATAKYFETSLNTLRAIRRVMRRGGFVVQMLAFNRPEEQLPRYLENMIQAGFSELGGAGDARIWRQVPNRKWHAAQKHKSHSSDEVVLVHRAV